MPNLSWAPAFAGKNGGGAPRLTFKLGEVGDLFRCLDEPLQQRQTIGAERRIIGVDRHRFKKRVKRRAQ